MNLEHARILLTTVGDPLSLELSEQLVDQGASLLLHIDAPTFPNNPKLAQRSNVKFLRANLKYAEGQSLLTHAALEFETNVLLQYRATPPAPCATWTRLADTLAATHALFESLHPWLQTQQEAAMITITCDLAYLADPAKMQESCTAAALLANSRAWRAKLAHTQIAVKHIAVPSNDKAMAKQLIQYMRSSQSESILASRQRWRARMQAFSPDWSDRLRSRTSPQN